MAGCEIFLYFINVICNFQTPQQVDDVEYICNMRNDEHLGKNKYIMVNDIHTQTIITINA
jgi:hypothetical protein